MRMKAKAMLTFAAGAAAAMAMADLVPVVSDVTMTQSAESRRVVVTYRLANAPAIVTLDVQTNRTGAATSVEADWVSIGGENIQRVSGDVWKEVAAGDDMRTISWLADKSWSGSKAENVRAKVTAWSLDNPPDYLVVDISATGGAGTERYYPSAEFLPGGLLANEDYRLGKIVMRKISASGVEWQMGGAPTEDGYAAWTDKLHAVTLTNDYYIGVFEVTQTQYELVQGEYADKAAPSNRIDRAMRPVETVSYNEIRHADHSRWSNARTYDYPAAPNPGSYLGRLRAKTGLLFDLPSEAQWEFACRAGNGVGKWNDGSAICLSEDASTDANLDALACYGTNVTAVVGSYKPNDWGLYDMHGNVWELCLDTYERNIASLKGAVNTTMPEGTENGKEERVRRGGGYTSGASKCRASNRSNTSVPADTTGHYVGFRLALPVPAKAQ